MSDDLRAVLQSVAFGVDGRITPGDRMRAIEQLREMPERRDAAESLSPDQVLEELQSFADAMPGMLVCARVAAGEDVFDVVEPPVEPGDLEELVEMQLELIDALEARLRLTERALQRTSVQRRLGPAPGFRV